MTATCIHLTDTEATVVLRPCWLARLFGARQLFARIARTKSGLSGSPFYGPWKTVATDESIDRRNPRHALILDALEYRPVAQLPEARVL